MLVTHDIDEALRLADHLVLMDGGVVVQQGEPLQMLLEPKNAFVETFFGRSEREGCGCSRYAASGIIYAGMSGWRAMLLTVSMTLREALSQFVAHRRDVLPVVDEQGEACGTLHFADLLRDGRWGVKALRDPLLWLVALFIALLLVLPDSAPLFSWRFPELPRPVYQQEEVFWR